MVWVHTAIKDESFYNLPLFSTIQLHILTNMHNVCLSFTKSQTNSNFHTVFTNCHKEISVNQKTPNSTPSLRTYLVQLVGPYTLPALVGMS